MFMKKFLVLSFVFLLTGCGLVTGSPSGISLEEFNQIENGMSYEQVVSIVGGEGELTAENELGQGTQFHTVTKSYSFNGESGLGANAILMFQNGELVSKAQYGLK
jgi:hypothetical protein